MLSQPDLVIEVIRKAVAAVQKCQPKQVYVSRAKEMPFARRRCRRATLGLFPTSRNLLPVEDRYWSRDLFAIGVRRAPSKARESHTA